MSGKSLQKLLEEVDQKKAQLDAFRPLPGEFIKELNQWFIVAFTYSSDALEGNTLTYDETALIIDNGMTIEGKSVQEHLEAVGHSVAVEYILDLAKCRRCDLTEDNLLHIYKLIFSRIEKENSESQEPFEETLKHLLKNHKALEELLDWLCSIDNHPILISTEAHFKLITEQPFVKGNGLIARLLMNLLLMQRGYLPAIIWPEDSNTYFKLLEEAQKTNNLEPLSEFVAKKVIDGYDLYLSKVKPPL